MFVIKTCTPKSGFCSLNLESLIKGLTNSGFSNKVGILY